MMADGGKNDGKTTGRDGKGRFSKGNDIGNQFQNGNNANPNGRRNAISDIFNELLDVSQDDRTVRESIAERMIAIATKTGNSKDFFNAFDRIIDRTEGKALERVQTHEVKDELIIE